MSRKILTSQEALERILPIPKKSLMSRSNSLANLSGFELVQTIETGGKPRLYIFSNGEQSIIASSEPDFPAILGIIGGCYDERTFNMNGTDGIISAQTDSVEWYQEYGYNLPPSYKAPTTPQEDEPVQEWGEGSADDPIVYTVEKDDLDQLIPKNIFSGNYYIEDNVVFKCIASIEGTTSHLVDLIGSNTQVYEVRPLLYDISHGWGLRVGYVASSLANNNTFYPISFYNKENKKKEYVPCGCNTLAISLIVAYWGSKGYYCGCKKSRTYVSADNDASGNIHRYDVEGMPGVYKFKYDDLLKEAYAGDNIDRAAAAARLELFQHVSRAVYSQFGEKATAASPETDKAAVAYNLNLAPSCKLISVGNTDSLNAIYEDLIHGRPVLMSKPGHTFVCDGFKSQLIWNGSKITGKFFHICRGSLMSKITSGNSTTYKRLVPSGSSNVTKSSSYDKYCEEDWYVLGPGAGDRYYPEGSTVTALVNIDPTKNPTINPNAEGMNDIKGDVNHDGYINMIDATLILNHIIRNPEQVYSGTLTCINGSSGLLITGPSGNMFLPYGGYIYKGDIQYKMSYGYYLCKKDNSYRMYALKGHLDSGYGDSYICKNYSADYKVNIRLVYKGNTPEEDGAIDIGQYTEGRNHVLWAPRNLGATTDTDCGLYFTNTVNLSNYGVDTSKWRLPTSAELYDLLSNMLAYYPGYDITGDGRVTLEDVNWIIDSILNKLVRLFYSSKNVSNEINISQISSTDELKDYVSSNTYYGGYYKTSYSSTLPEYTIEGSQFPPLLPYSSDNAAVSSETVLAGKQYYLHEVLKYATVPIIVGQDFTAVPWEGPLSRAYIGTIPEEQANIVSDNLGETVDSFPIVKNGVNQIISNENGNYILFSSAVPQSTIVTNGITIETLDGVLVKLEFTALDFTTQYQQWSLAQ